VFEADGDAAEFAAEFATAAGVPDISGAPGAEEEVR
jgi:hypothetical protein